MEKKVIGKITVIEKNEIEKLYFRKLALNELVISLLHYDENLSKDNNVLYGKIINDLSDTNKSYNYFFSKIKEKYKLDIKEECELMVNFETNELLL